MQATRQQGRGARARANFSKFKRSLLVVQSLLFTALIVLTATEAPRVDVEI